MSFMTVLSSLFALVLSMAFVIALAWGTIWLLRKWQDRQLEGSPSADTPSRSLRFVRALPLGQRERVVLIEVGDETMLLGIGSGPITLLSRWDASGRVIADAPAPMPYVPPIGARMRE